MTIDTQELKSSGSTEFDKLAALAAQAGFRIFPKTRQIVAADNGSSGSAEVALARFSELIRKQVIAEIAAQVIPDFAGIEDKRMSELTPEQQDDAMELWLRKQILSFDTYHQEKLKLLLGRLDKVRALLTQ